MSSGFWTLLFFCISSLLISERMYGNQRFLKMKSPRIQKRQQIIPRILGFSKWISQNPKKFQESKVCIFFRAVWTSLTRTWPWPRVWGGKFLTWWVVDPQWRTLNQRMGSNLQFLVLGGVSPIHVFFSFGWFVELNFVFGPFKQGYPIFFCGSLVWPHLKLIIDIPSGLQASFRETIL